MKRISAILLAAVMIFSFAACSKKGDLGKQTTTNAKGIVEYNTVGTFDFSDYKKENEDKAVTEGFKNIEESKCLDKGAAKKLAANELTEGFEYDTLRIAYDRTEGMWRVSYSISETGAAENICIDSDGITQLIVKE